MDTRHIIVNYHYVESPKPERSGIVPCNLNEFERQIKHLASNYKIGSMADVFWASKNGSKENACAITFDDGLRCQFVNALPILKKFSAAATFFPITSTWDGFLPTTHKIHVLLSKLPIRELIMRFNEFLKERHHQNLALLIPTSRRIGPESTHKVEDFLTTNFKSTMALAPDDVKAEFLGDCFSLVGLDEERLSRELFMSKEEVYSLQREGFAIGNHSHSHFSYRIQDPSFLRKDFESSRKFLKDLLGREPLIYSYPHGQPSEALLDLLRKENFQYGVTIENRALKASDDPLLIPRLDTNYIKGL